jgi:hypothetical protein
MTINRLNQGTTNQVLVKAISGQTTNLLELQDSSGSVVSSIGPTGALTGIGKILQVVRATDSTDRSTTSTSTVDVSGMAITITPTKSTSKILVIATGSVKTSWSTGDAGIAYLRLTDNSNNTISARSEYGTFNLTGTGTRQAHSGFTIVGWAEPNTTSAVSYKLRMFSDTANVTSTITNSQGPGQVFAIEVAA